MHNSQSDAVLGNEILEREIKEIKKGRLALHQVSPLEGQHGPPYSDSYYGPYFTPQSI